MALRKFTYIDATEGFAVEQGASDELSLGKITLAGVGGVAIDGGGAEAVDFLDPTTAQSLATKHYVDAVATGLDWKNSVHLATTAALSGTPTAAGTGVGKTLTATSNGALTVDSVAAANGDRILVKNQATAANNGIYVVTDAGSGGTPYILTRATDADENVEVTSGLAVFATAGTVNAFTGWVMTSADPITVDTTALTFAQFSASTAYTFDQGLSLSGSSVKVELHTAADAASAGAGGGSSGLEFDANTAAGKLRVAVDPFGGINRDSAGISILQAFPGGNQTLDIDAPGVTVVAAPRVRASIPDSTGGTNVGDPVCVDTADHVIKADAATSAKARVIGVSNTVTSSPDDDLQFVVSGTVPGALTSATPNTPYFLASGGGLTITRPTGGARIIRVGWALNATDLWVDIQDLGKSV